jgi:hypothetical protein
MGARMLGKKTAIVTRAQQGIGAGIGRGLPEGGLQRCRPRRRGNAIARGWGQERSPIIATNGEIAQIKDVVDAVLYLVQADQVIGEILHVDGGSHAGRW